PGCSSFDMFKSFEDRGNQFRALAKARAAQTRFHDPTSTTTKKERTPMDNNSSMLPQQTGGLKLMTVFIAVLALHVLVIGGFTVYHLMSSGGDADLALDKNHKLK